MPRWKIFRNMQYSAAKVNNLQPLQFFVPRQKNPVAKDTILWIQTRRQKIMMKYDGIQLSRRRGKQHLYQFSSSQQCQSKTKIRGFLLSVDKIIVVIILRNDYMRRFSMHKHLLLLPFVMSMHKVGIVGMV